MGREAVDSARPWRLIVVDDHPLFRSAIQHLLGTPPDLEVVGEAADGQEALNLCRTLRPDLVLMDVQMPRMDGITATRQIKRELPDTPVLILTNFEDPGHLFEAIEAGAAGYVLKSAAAHEITEAIRAVLRGESPLSKELSAMLLRRLVAERQQRPPEDAASERPAEERPVSPLANPLAPREVEVLRLVARGQTNQEIAHNLFISTGTVKKYLRAIIAKLGVSDRIQAAVRAVELGLLSEEDDKEGRGPFV